MLPGFCRLGAWACDADLIATIVSFVFGDMNLEVMCTCTWEIRMQVSLRSEHFEQMSFSRGGEHVALVSDVKVNVWNVASGQLLYRDRLDMPDWYNSTCAWALNGRALALVNGSSDRVQVVDVATWTSVWVRPMQGHTVLRVRWSPVGTSMLCLCEPSLAFITTINVAADKVHACLVNFASIRRSQRIAL